MVNSTARRVPKTKLRRKSSTLFDGCPLCPQEAVQLLGPSTDHHPRQVPFLGLCSQTLDRITHGGQLRTVVRRRCPDPSHCLCLHRVVGCLLSGSFWLLLSGRVGSYASVVPSLYLSIHTQCTPRTARHIGHQGDLGSSQVASLLTGQVAMSSSAFRSSAYEILALSDSSVSLVLSSSSAH